MFALLSLAVWLGLVLFHGRFWSSTPQLQPAACPDAPAVDIVIPARDEAETIGRVIASLAAQVYPGKFRLILVDDNSRDGTAALAAKSLPAECATPPELGIPEMEPVELRPRSAPELTIIDGAPKPPGWSGKLWALNQGVAAGDAPLVLFTDADIVHDSRHLCALVARLQAPPVDLVSEMVRLNCTSVAERLLVPAFIYFFQMLYPFAKVNDFESATAAAAGGTVLLRRDALLRIGGLAAIRSALIDDVALAKAVKPGGPIYLGHSGLAASIRRYPHFADIWDMIARTAFTQLRYSSWLLLLTLLGLTLVWWVPIAFAVFGHGWQQLAGAAAFTLSAASYLPTLRRYHLAFWWSLLLPLIALFYMAATLKSAVNHWRGAGARWKDREYAA